jgi:NAD(P)-dependent dehydrogenase (short-subunit alcohol dehydrogenase family)
MVKAPALHLAHDAVRVNVICPGPIDTQMFPAFFSARPNASPEQLVEQNALHRFACTLGVPEEFASAALFLASDDSSYITGSHRPSTGGRLAC